MPPPCLIPEFAPQSGVMVVWPHARSDWRDSLETIEPLYLEIVCALSRHESVLVVCYDERHVCHVSKRLQQAGAIQGAVRCVAVPGNDTWVRDYGPLAVAGDGGPRLLDFVFDGWGGKYPAALDNLVSRQLFDAGVFNVTALESQTLVLEGGSIETDGCGTLLTTTPCLLGAGRNPGLDREALQARLNECLGSERVLWLDHGYLRGDDTDGHVDMLARFCTPDCIAYVQCTDPGDEHYSALTAMEQELQAFRTVDGRPYDLRPLPLPQPVYSGSGERLPASYANFLIINAAVLVPVYDDPADDRAMGVLQQCFPGREMIAINCLPLIRQYGSLHCATMQLPAGVLSF